MFNKFKCWLLGHSYVAEMFGLGRMVGLHTCSRCGDYYSDPGKYGGIANDPAPFWKNSKFPK